jgi:hypothetical protein
VKIVITYETADIVRLIRQDLARQGIAAADGDVKCPKGVAVVHVEVQPGDEPPVAAPPPAPAPVRADAGVDQLPRQAPALTPVEGGAEVADMSDVFRASRHLEKTTEGKFPPRERQLLEGESYDPPEEFNR